MDFACYSGKVDRFFVPIDKILKPVLLECVTPVTCYWTLSLIVRGESEMVLVFKVKLYFFSNRFHSKGLFYLVLERLLLCFWKARRVVNSHLNKAFAVLVFSLLTNEESLNLLLLELTTTS